jgi:hypothetical protein
MKYICPVCESELSEFLGHQMHPGNPAYGVTLYCPSRTCPAQEVSGHGDNVKGAWSVIQQKFVGRINANG